MKFIVYAFTEWLIRTIFAALILGLAALAFYGATILLNIATGLFLLFAIVLYIIVGWLALIGFFLAVLSLVVLIGEYN